MSASKAQPTETPRTTFRRGTNSHGGKSISRKDKVLFYGDRQMLRAIFGNASTGKIHSGSGGPSS